MNYFEKLKDPRWQRKRLEILTRDEFMCQACGDTQTELQVHHMKYNNDPWDADPEYLVTLCCDCHKNVSEANKSIKEDLIEMGNWHEMIYEMKDIVHIIKDKCTNPLELLKLRKYIENFNPNE